MLVTAARMMCIEAADGTREWERNKLRALETVYKTGGTVCNKKKKNKTSGVQQSWAAKRASVYFHGRYVFHVSF